MLGMVRGEHWRLSTNSRSVKAAVKVDWMAVPLMGSLEGMTLSQRAHLQASELSKSVKAALSRALRSLIMTVGDARRSSERQVDMRKKDCSWASASDNNHNLK